MTRKAKIISLNVDDIGISKLNVIHFKYCPKKLRDLIRVNFDKLDCRRIKKIKLLTKKYNLPVAWAVVPYYLDVFSFQKIRFDEALPGVYCLIKKYVEEGDEVIQHGNCHFSPNKNIVSNEEFCTEDERLSLEKQKKLLNHGWEALVKMGLKPKKIIQFPCWKADDNSIKALLQLGYKGVLAKNLLYPQTILNKKKERIKIDSSIQTKLYDLNLTSIFTDNEPLNLNLHPSQGKEFNNLRELLKVSEGKKVKFIKISQALSFF